MFSNIHMITPLQDILVKQSHSTKSGNITTGQNFLFMSRTTADCVLSVPMPNLCTTNLTDFKQLLIPEKPWNSIYMDFIEKLPPSSGYTSNLVIGDCLSKQSRFIPTHDTIMSQQLAQL